MEFVMNVVNHTGPQQSMSFLSQYNQVLKKECALHSKPQFHFKNGHCIANHCFTSTYLCSETSSNFYS